MQSTPCKNSSLEEGQYINKDNTGTLKETDNQNKVYKNSSAINNDSKQETQTHQESTGQTLEAGIEKQTGIENSQNEWQDAVSKTQ